MTIPVSRSFYANAPKCATNTEQSEGTKRVKLTATVNRVILIGRAGATPIVKKVKDKDMSIGTFSMATDNTMTPDGKKTANWHSIVAFDDNVIKLMHYISKG